MNSADYEVWLGSAKVGRLSQRGDYTQFRFLDDYVNDPDRGVLGLAFEPNLAKLHTSALRLPPWFSNLLPEGRLRDWIASDRQVSSDREMELLAQVGADLPGAVRVLLADAPHDENPVPRETTSSEYADGTAEERAWKFSLAGVGIKFSMTRAGDRLTIPASGLGGDWIVKLPDPEFPDVPLNEFAMMDLAQLVGINVPDHELVHRDSLERVPDQAWQSSEVHAYAVRRFDRGPKRELIHIEDFAQIRGIYPYNNGKYAGNFETVAALIYRNHDTEALREFARRTVFNIMIANGDAHLKNWSLIYSDPRRPTLSPAYDLVSTQFYNPGIETSALKFGGSKRFETMRLAHFGSLEKKLGATGANLTEVAHETVQGIQTHWPSVEDSLSDNQDIAESIDATIKLRARTLLGPSSG